VAQTVGCDEAEVIARLTRLLELGVVRRIGVVPNHYALGTGANGMTVWDVADDRIADLGPRVGALAFVSHCYRRPRSLPHWPYNLFAMLHGQDRQEVEDKRQAVARLLGRACRAHDVLYSKRILKKTGLRLATRKG
jgi:DNA-binding Lrp family transcriptional regulator